MTAKVNADLCIGCGLCETACPEVFKMEDDKAVVIGASVPAEVAAQCKQAATDCPVEAIEIAG